MKKLIFLICLFIASPLSARPPGIACGKAKITSGTIDGTVIGGTDPAAGTFTSIHAKSGDSGTTASADADELVVEGAGNTGISILGGSYSQIYFGSVNGPRRGKILYYNNGDTLYMTVNEAYQVIKAKQHDYVSLEPEANFDRGIGLFSITYPTANGAKVLWFGANAADPTLGIDTAGLYAKDVSGTVEMFAVDEAGNVTQISPHTPDWPPELAVSSTYPQVHTDTNKYLGKKRYIAMGRLAELVQKLAHTSGLLPADKKLVVYKDVKKADWSIDQQAKVASREIEIDKIKEQIAAIDGRIEILEAKKRTKAEEKELVDLRQNRSDLKLPAHVSVKPIPKWIGDRIK